MGNVQRPGPAAADRDAANPLTIAWSPDSRHLLYAHDGRVKRIAVDGGPPQIVYDVPNSGLLGAAWFPSGAIVLGAPGGIVRLPAGGGAAEALTTADAAAGETHMVLGALPGGRFLYTRGGPPGARRLYVASATAPAPLAEGTPILTADLGAQFRAAGRRRRHRLSPRHAR